MTKSSLQLNINNPELQAQNYLTYSDSPKYPPLWIGNRYFHIWRLQKHQRGENRNILTYKQIKKILVEDKPHTVWRFIHSAMKYGLFVRIKRGTYFILPPNRTFNSLSLHSKYLAQIHRLSSMFSILKTSHVFICMGINHYSQYGINEVHLGLLDTNDMTPDLGDIPINIWKLDPSFFKNAKRIQGPRYSYLNMYIPSSTDIILLAAFTRLPRFELILDNILETHNVDIPYLLSSAPFLQLGNRFRSLLEEKQGLPSEEDIKYTSRQITLPKILTTQQMKLLQIESWD